MEKWRPLSCPPIFEETKWYVVGKGSFLTNDKAIWNISSGTLMSLNKSYTGSGREYLATITFENGDEFKLTNGEQWITDGWENTIGAFENDHLGLIADGYGGSNVRVYHSGSYDIYFKVYPGNSGYNCYIEDSR